MLNPDAEQSHEIQSGDTPQLLIVDDDPLILATLTIGLAQSGYQVLEANSGEMALELCQQHRPQLVIMDIQMSGMSGIDAARQIYEQYHIPFLFLTAVTERYTVNSAVREGALGFLVKPIELTQLIPSIETALQRAQEFQSLKHQNVHLETALSQNRDVSIAIGIMVAHSDLNASEAEAALRQYARKNRTKMADLAKHIITAANQLNNIINHILQDDKAE
ncbi:MAG: response regulator [Gammaproteobacteria bacterium]|jgi:two-component system, response regulator PdtaR